jgi:hypothetical protein
VVVDIKLGSNRDEFKLKPKGDLPASILGSNDYDVTEIDVSSLLFEREVAPLRSRLRRGAGDCMDLRLKFSSQAVRNALGNLQPDRTYDVWITGKFKDGTPMQGSYSFVAAPPSRGKRFSGVMKAGKTTGRCEEGSKTSAATSTTTGSGKKEENRTVSKTIEGKAMNKRSPSERY